MKDKDMNKKIVLVILISFIFVPFAFSDNLNDELMNFLIHKKETPQEKFSQDILVLNIYVEGQEKPNGYVIPRITAYMFMDYLYTKRSFEQTIEFCHAVTVSDAKSGYAYYKMGESYEALGKVEKAVAVYKEVIENSPNYSYPHFRLWGIYTFDKDDNIKAKSYWNSFNATLAKPSKISDTREKKLLTKDLFILGSYFLDESREFDKALKFFNMVLKLDPKHERTKLNIAMGKINKSIVLKDKDLFESAIKDIEQIAENSKDSQVISFIEQFLRHQVNEMRKNNFEK